MKEERGGVGEGPEKNVGRNRVDNTRSKSTLSYVLPYFYISFTAAY